MIRETFTLGLGLGAILLSTQALRAQDGNCAERGVIVERLASQYGESRQAIGMAGDRQVVEVFASLETGSWTILVTTTSGIACLVAAGQHFEHLNEPLPGEPA